MKKGRMPYPQSGRVHLIGQPEEPEQKPQPILPRGLHRYLVAVAIERPGQFPTFESLIEERSRPLCEGVEIAELQQNTAKALAGDGPEPKVTIISISRMLFLDQEIVDKIEARKKEEAEYVEAYIKDPQAGFMGHCGEFLGQGIPRERREVLKGLAAEIRAEREREAKERADGMPACADCDQPVTIAEAEAGGGRCPACAAVKDCIPADAVPCAPCGECGQTGEPITDCRVSADRPGLSLAGWVCQNRECNRYHAGMFPAEAYSMTNAEILARGGTVPTIEDAHQVAVVGIGKDGETA